MRMNVSSAERTLGRRAAKNAATTAALLHAAGETFATRGFESATMDEIADRVGLSKGALYYRYKSKEELFLALLDERCDTYIRQLDEAFAPGSPPAGGWTSMARLFLAVLEDEEWPRLFFEFVSYASRSDRAKRELARRTRAVRAALSRVLERQSREAGIDLPVPPERLALGISALCNGLAVERLADPGAIDDDAFVEIPALLMAGAALRAGHEPRGRAASTPERTNR
jgi:AcrR family transcriptional regulator